MARYGFCRNLKYEYQREPLLLQGPYNVVKDLQPRVPPLDIHQFVNSNEVGSCDMYRGRRDWYSRPSDRYYSKKKRRTEKYSNDIGNRHNNLIYISKKQETVTAVTDEKRNNKKLKTKDISDAQIDANKNCQERDNDITKENITANLKTDSKLKASKRSGVIFTPDKSDKGETDADNNKSANICGVQNNNDKETHFGTSNSEIDASTGYTEISLKDIDPNKTYLDSERFSLFNDSQILEMEPESPVSKKSKLGTGDLSNQSNSAIKEMNTVLPKSLGLDILKDVSVKRKRVDSVDEKLCASPKNIFTHESEPKIDHRETTTRRSATVEDTPCGTTDIFTSNSRKNSEAEDQLTIKINTPIENKLTTRRPLTLDDTVCGTSDNLGLYPTPHSKVEYAVNTKLVNTPIKNKDKNTASKLTMRRTSTIDDIGCSTSDDVGPRQYLKTEDVLINKTNNNASTEHKGEATRSKLTMRRTTTLNDLVCGTSDNLGLRPTPHLKAEYEINTKIVNTPSKSKDKITRSKLTMKRTSTLDDIACGTTANLNIPSRRSSISEVKTKINNASTDNKGESTRSKLTQRRTSTLDDTVRGTASNLNLHSRRSSISEVKTKINNTSTDNKGESTRSKSIQRRTSTLDDAVRGTANNLNLHSRRSSISEVKTKFNNTSTDNKGESTRSKLTQRRTSTLDNIDCSTSDNWRFLPGPSSKVENCVSKRRDSTETSKSIKKSQSSSFPEEHVKTNEGQRAWYFSGLNNDYTIPKLPKTKNVFTEADIPFLKPINSLFAVSDTDDHSSQNKNINHKSELSTKIYKRIGYNKQYTVSEKFDKSSVEKKEDAEKSHNCKQMSIDKETLKSDEIDVNKTVKKRSNSDLRKKMKKMYCINTVPKNKNKKSRNSSNEQLSSNNSGVNLDGKTKLKLIQNSKPCRRKSQINRSRTVENKKLVKKSKISVNSDVSIFDQPLSEIQKSESLKNDRLLTCTSNSEQDKVLEANKHEEINSSIQSVKPRTLLKSEVQSSKKISCTTISKDANANTISKHNDLSTQTNGIKKNDQAPNVDKCDVEINKQANINIFKKSDQSKSSSKIETGLTSNDQEISEQPRPTTHLQETPNEEGNAISKYLFVILTDIERIKQSNIKQKSVDRVNKETINTVDICATSVDKSSTSNSSILKESIFNASKTNCVKDNSESQFLNIFKREDMVDDEDNNFLEFEMDVKNIKRPFIIDEHIKIGQKFECDEIDDKYFPLLIPTFPQFQNARFTIFQDEICEKAVVMEAPEIQESQQNVVNIDTQEIVKIQAEIPIIDLTEDDSTESNENLYEIFNECVTKCEEKITLYRSDETSNNQLEVQAMSVSLTSTVLKGKQQCSVKSEQNPVVKDESVLSPGISTEQRMCVEVNNEVTISNHSEQISDDRVEEVHTRKGTIRQEESAESQATNSLPANEEEATNINEEPLTQIRIENFQDSINLQQIHKVVPAINEVLVNNRQTSQVSNQTKPAEVTREDITSVGQTIINPSSGQCQNEIPHNTRSPVIENIRIPESVQESSVNPEQVSADTRALSLRTEVYTIQNWQRCMADFVLLSYHSTNMYKVTADLLKVQNFVPTLYDLEMSLLHKFQYSKWKNYALCLVNSLEHMAIHNSMICQPSRSIQTIYKYLRAHKSIKVAEMYVYLYNLMHTVKAFYENHPGFKDFYLYIKDTVTAMENRSKTLSDKGKYVFTPQQLIQYNTQVDFCNNLCQPVAQNTYMRSSRGGTVHHFVKQKPIVQVNQNTPMNSSEIQSTTNNLVRPVVFMGGYQPVSSRVPPSQMNNNLQQPVISTNVQNASVYNQQTVPRKPNKLTPSRRQLKTVPINKVLSLPQPKPTVNATVSNHQQSNLNVRQNNNLKQLSQLVQSLPNSNASNPSAISSRVPPPYKPIIQMPPHRTPLIKYLNATVQKITVQHDPSHRSPLSDSINNVPNIPQPFQPIVQSYVPVSLRSPLNKVSLAHSGSEIPTSNETPSDQENTPIFRVPRKSPVNYSDASDNSPHSKIVQNSPLHNANTDVGSPNSVKIINAQMPSGSRVNVENISSITDETAGSRQPLPNSSDDTNNSHDDAAPASTSKVQLLMETMSNEEESCDDDIIDLTWLDNFEDEELEKELGFIVKQEEIDEDEVILNQEQFPVVHIATPSRSIWDPPSPFDPGLD